LFNKLYEVFVCLAAVLFTTLIENLRLYSSAEAGIFLICS